MLVTDDDDLYEKALRIADQGRNPSKVFWIDEHGVKFKMSNIQLHWDWLKSSEQIQISL